MRCGLTSRLVLAIVGGLLANPWTQPQVVGQGLGLSTSPASSSDSAPQYGAETVQRWRVGAIVRATQGPVRGLSISIPVPTDWPDQTVKVIEEEMSDQVTNVGYRDLDSGIRQMLVTIPAVDPGQEARVALLLEITTRATLAPAETDSLQIPRNPPRDIKRHLGISPFINSRHRTIKKLAEELTSEGGTPWEQVERIYDWVRENIERTNDPMKGAVDTLQDKSGCAEDCVSLFVGLCRAAKVPARFVWVHNHQYAEFYLEGEDGEGHWYPCQIVGDREFGAMSEIKPILQRGDNIMVPEKDEPYRFVPELVKGVAGGGRPSVTFLRDQAAMN